MEDQLKRIAIALTLSFCAARATPQQQGSTFWQTPGETLRDRSGKIVFQEIKDPRTFTTRVYDGHNWFVYKYEPNTEKLIGVEAPDSKEDYLYDDTGAQIGIRVHGFGRPLTVRGSRRDAATDGMPPVTLETGNLDSLISIHYGPSAIAQMDYAPSGEARKFTLANATLAFDVTPDAVRELLTFNGKVVRDATVVIPPLLSERYPKTTIPPSLEVAARQLALPPDWRTELHVRSSATGTVTSVYDGSTVKARLVQYGGTTVAFDKAGEAVFYDITIGHGAPGGWANSDRNRALERVVPSHVVITRDGIASAYLTWPADNAISTVWVSLADPTIYGHTIWHASASSRSGTSLRPSTQEVVPVNTVNARRAVTPLLLYQCGSNESFDCVDRGGSSYCDYVYTPIWCDDGGGYTPPPDDGGGGGGSSGSYANNKVIGDPQMTIKVNWALITANNKFAASTQCSESLFAAMLVYGGRATAEDVLASYGASPDYWLNNVLNFWNGTGVRDPQGTDLCATGVPAWTTVGAFGSGKVYVCSAFKNLTSTMGGDILIHEMLHSLGVSEKPADPNAPFTSEQLTQQVIQFCGN